MNSGTQKYDLSLHFYKHSEQQIGSYTCISGLVKLRDVFKLFDAVDLDSNPRFAKVNAVTRDIGESIEKHSDLFPLMTNGILLSSTDYQMQERGRIKLNFKDSQIEGVLNGGHNLLAVGALILELATGKKMRSGLNWIEARKVLRENTLEIKDYLEDEGNEARWGRMMPCELIVPTDTSEIGISKFRDQIPLVQAARNNNNQLSRQTFANHEGLFDEMRELVDQDLRSKVQWKQNDDGGIDVRELIAMCWMAISKIDRDFFDDSGRRITPPTAVQSYSSKGVVFDRFVEVAKSRDVSRKADGKYDIQDEAFLSALKIGVNLPLLFEQVQKLVPSIYNSTGARFGGLRTVQAAEKKGKKQKTKFYGEDLDTPVDDGFVWPLFYSLRELIVQDPGGKLKWMTDPHDFIGTHFEEYGSTLKDAIESVGGDPGAVGKMSPLYGSFIKLTKALVLEHVS